MPSARTAACCRGAPRSGLPSSCCRPAQLGGPIGDQLLDPVGKTGGDRILVLRSEFGSRVVRSADLAGGLGIGAPARERRLLRRPGLDGARLTAAQLLSLLRSWWVRSVRLIIAGQTTSGSDSAALTSDPRPRTASRYGLFGVDSARLSAGDKGEALGRAWSRRPRCSAGPAEPDAISPERSPCSRGSRRRADPGCRPAPRHGPSP